MSRENDRWQFDQGMSDGVRGLEKAQQAAERLGWSETAETLGRVIEEADEAGMDARDSDDEEE